MPEIHNFDIQPEDLEPLDDDVVTEQAIRKYVRKAAGIPDALDIELTDNYWATQGASGEWYVDGYTVQITTGMPE